MSYSKIAELNDYRSHIHPKRQQNEKNISLHTFGSHWHPDVEELSTIVEA